MYEFIVDQDMTDNGDNSDDGKVGNMLASANDDGDAVIPDNMENGRIVAH